MKIFQLNYLHVNSWNRKIVWYIGVAAAQEVEQDCKCVWMLDRKKKKKLDSI